MIERSDFISESLCDWLVNFHSLYFSTLGSTDTTNDCEYLDILIAASKLQDETSSNTSDPLKYLLSTINIFLKEVSPTSYVNYAQIVKYSTGTSFPAHLDHGFTNSTSILYLNDNFSGGETIVNNYVVKPVKGKIVSFNGNALTHEVTKITSGDRYVVAIWSKDWNEFKN